MVSRTNTSFHIERKKNRAFKSTEQSHLFFFAGIVSLKLAQDEHRTNEKDLRTDKRALKVGQLRGFVVVQHGNRGYSYTLFLFFFFLRLS